MGCGVCNCRGRVFADQYGCWPDVHVVRALTAAPALAAGVDGLESCARWLTPTGTRFSVLAHVLAADETHTTTPLLSLVSSTAKHESPLSSQNPNMPRWVPIGVCVPRRR